MKQRVLMGSIVAACAVLAGFSAVDAATSCEAEGHSDGVSAQALAQCRRVPDGLILEPLTCVDPTFGLVVEDDTDIAVFPDRLVANLTVSPEPVMGEGFDNHYGTVLSPTASHSTQAVGVAVAVDHSERRFSATGRWWSRTCWAHSVESGLWSPIGTDGPFPEGPEKPLGEIVAEAEARLNPPPVPAVEFAGPVSVAQLPTWFWVETSWWDGDFRADNRHGLVTVSVFAVPTRWSLRHLDGDVIVNCEGQGVRWRRGIRGGGCTHAFDEPGATSLQLTVELETSWTTSLAGYGVQRLPSLWRASVGDHDAVEVVGLRGN
ncbi:MAG: hypothetical protein HKN24_00545 [Acidimicrobiales bacterium]|nr:hypothetical protein [Acidimicrobiales bacterium]